MLHNIKFLFTALACVMLFSCSSETTATAGSNPLEKSIVKGAEYPNLIGKYERMIQVQSLDANCQQAFGISDNTAYDKFVEAFKVTTTDNIELFQSKSKIGYKYQNVEIAGSVSTTGAIQLSETSQSTTSQCNGFTTSTGFELSCTGKITHHNNKPLANECTIQAQHVATRL